MVPKEVCLSIHFKFYYVFVMYIKATASYNESFSKSTCLKKLLINNTLQE